jgi:hypothetical protein
MRVHIPQTRNHKLSAGVEDFGVFRDSQVFADFSNAISAHNNRHIRFWLVAGHINNRRVAKHNRAFFLRLYSTTAERED